MLSMFCVKKYFLHYQYLMRNEQSLPSHREIGPIAPCHWTIAPGGDMLAFFER